MKKGPALRRLAQNNKGSAIITVVISMLFVVALGTALLFAAYMGIQVSVSARNEKDNFYDASAAMDEVKILIQDQVSTALKAAYTQTLVEYAKLQTTNPQSTLYTKFMDELEIQGIFDYTYDAGLDTTTITVDVDKLKEVIPANATLTGESDAQVGTDEFTIKGLELAYIDDDGYESRIATDLVVEIPDFFTGANGAGGLGNYAIIAETEFKSFGNKAEIIDGGIFAGPSGISTTGNGDILRFSGGRIVTSGSIQTKGNSTLSLTPGNYDIWAQEIVANRKGILKLNGNIYVADDLVLNGGSAVTLSGQYYGFGSDDADTVGRNDDESSSIFVNSYITNEIASLDISGLSQLSLAGVSFININSGVATGQSLASKSDQLAYLIPDSALSNYKTNPCAAIVEDEKCVPPVVNTAAVLWTIDGEKKTLAYYLGDSNVTDNNYTGTNGSILSYFMQDTISNNDSDMVGYFFINFTNQQMANEYFRDYFTAKPDSIKQYLDLYLGMTDSSSTVTITKGNTYEKLSSSWQNILGNSVFPDTQADFLASQFESLTQSPMDRYVNRDKLDASIGQKLFKNGSGVVVAIVKNGDCSYPDDCGDKVKVIIATGDVNVNAGFTGIIIAGGKVTLNNKIVSFAKPTDEILASMYGTEKLSDYLNAAVFSDDQTEKINEWSPERLVYYNNWQKN